MLSKLFTVPPLQPFDLIAKVYSTSAQMYWTVHRAVFGIETYSVIYGVTPDNLDMESQIISGFDVSLENATYAIILDNLQPLTVYYYSIRAENLAGATYSDIENFTTRKVPYNSTSYNVLLHVISNTYRGCSDKFSDSDTGEHYFVTKYTHHNR